MNILELLQHLRDLGVRLTAEGTQLKIQAPKGSLTPAMRTLLAEHKLAILDLLQSVRAAPHPALPISRVERSNVEPLALAQERLWFVQQLAPASAAYHIPIVIELSGPLDRMLLCAALNSIIRRHEALRTGIVVTDGMPLQRIVADTSVDIPMLALAPVPGETEETAFTMLIRREIQRPIDLTAPPLLHALLVALAPERAALVLTIHHLVADGWSVGVLARELMAAYGALRWGTPDPRLPMDIQYADYAAWQRRWLAEHQAQQIQFWCRQLASEPPMLCLPYRQARPALQDFSGARVPVALGSAESAAVRRLAIQEGTTPFVVLLACFAALLTRSSGQTDLWVGAPVAQRTHPQLEGLIGFFVNTLVFRINTGDAPTFQILVQRARAVTEDALAHQDVPFASVVEAVSPTRSLSHNPLFQVMFMLQNAPMPPLELGDIAIRHLNIDPGTAKVDLSLDLTELDGCFCGWFEYSTELFERATIEQLAGQWRALTGACGANPAQAIDVPPLLAPDEEARIAGWERTSTVNPAELCVHELFAEQARRTPAAVAVRDSGCELTYAELDCHANQLAHVLRTHGVGAETRVGLAMDRSASTIIAMLAVLKAGGTYVPLEIGAPQDRLLRLVSNASLQLLLVIAEIAPVFTTCDCPVIDVAIAREMAEREPVSPPHVQVAPDQLAYLMYTSGSTGQPKGVAVAHRSITRLVYRTNYIHVQPHDRILHLASEAFDASTLEIWAPLLNGACMVIYPAGLLDLSALAAMLRAERISIAWLTAGLFHQMVETQLEALAGVRIVLAGGDVLSPDHVRRLLAAPGQRQVINGYGPTENTTFTCCHVMASPAEVGAQVPIGAPIAHTQVHILDLRLQRVPIGFVGELYAAGAGLARGYWNQPALTAERFLPDPFGGAGARMYRTGDLARWHRSGAVEFLGRADQQVKIRGFRIEPGEIETVLRAHPAVSDCLVAPYANPDKRLCAYVILRDESPGIIAAISAFARERLPEYMVPVAFIALQGFPLTANGKVDRGALPLPAGQRPQLSTALVRPRTATEEQLAIIFAELLNSTQLGIDDSFFELGGHSLLATQAVARIREHFNCDLSLTTFFAVPTIVALGAQVDGQSARKQAYQPIPRTASSGPGHHPLSFAQERLWFLDQLGMELAAYNMPFAMEMRGDLDIAALERSLEALAARHAVLRTRIGADDGVPWQVIDEPGPLPLAMLDVSGAEPAALDGRLREEALRPFDLSTGPLWRTLLLRCGERRSILSLTLHHIIADGWSIGIIVRELSALYSAFRRGSAPELPALPIDYVDFACWQHSPTVIARLETQLQYWREQLTDSPRLDLPLDRPRPQQPSQRGGSVRCEIDSDTTDRLRRLGGQSGATLFMVLLAAFNVLLHRQTGQRDVVIGTTIANRQRRELEPLIGFFVNVLALRTRVRPEQSFSKVVQAMRETALAAFANQDAPFEKLVEMLHQERDLTENPLFQVMFSLQNAPIDTLRLDDVTLRLLVPEAPPAKFDLDIDVWEQAESLSVHIVYAADLFDHATIERMATHYQQLLRELSAVPERPIGRSSLLPSEEISWLLRAGRPAAAPADVRCLHALFQTEAQARPDAPAVAAAGVQITYGALEERANQLAHHLRRSGLGPEQCVGIYLDRSIEQVVAVLAVWKAGGAYVPLDPAYPQERLAAMLDAADCQLVIGQTGALPSQLLTERAGIYLDELVDELAMYPATPPYNLAEPDNLAYVLFTSGSTGQPKGVMVTHRNVAFMRAAWQAAYAVGPGHAHLQLASFSFDVWVGNLIRALGFGGRLVLCGQEVVLDPVALYALLVEEDIDYIEIVPVLLRGLLQYIRQAALPFPALRALIVGSDIWRVGEHQATQALAGNGVQLINSYGTTETTIDSTLFEIGMGGGGPEQIALGVPLPNVEVYILDELEQLAPIGVPGELYIGGESLTRGYAGQPGLTAARFVPHPFASAPGERLYRTGDLARWHADGTLEFLGRADNQVKLRGLRLELGEVEMALRRHAGVADAVAMIRDATEGQRLIAYVVPQPGAFIDTTELRQWLRSVVPAHAIPSQIAVLESLPLSPNGKVDVRQLPAPAADEQSGPADPPRTPVEIRIAAICARLLGIEQISREANLFDLGAHSLLATQVAAHIRQAFEIALPLRHLFATPTVADLAVQVERELEQPAALPALADQPRPTRIPLSFAQQRLWFLDQLEPGNPAYSIPAALRICGPFTPAALQFALDRVIERHEILRTTFQVEEGRPWQMITPPQPFTLTYEDLAMVQEGPRQTAIAAAMQREARTAFDLVRGPLLRVHLLHLAENTHLLLFTMHHIISDAWSMSVLVRELTALYTAAQSDQPVLLPALPVQYADFTLWQRTWLSGALVEQQLDYWRHQLAMPPTLVLPAERPRPPELLRHSAELPIHWPEPLVAGLRALAAQEQATLFMTVLAALKTLLYRYTGQADLIVGTPVACRQRPELEHCIGFFVNMLALRTNLAGNLPFREVLRRVRATALAGYAHQDLPFEKLVEALQPDRPLDGTPFFRVVCALDDMDAGAFEVAGAQIEHVRISTGAAMFDLVISLVDAGSVINGTIVYNSALFAKETIAMLAIHLERILAESLLWPDVPVLAIPLAEAPVGGDSVASSHRDAAEVFNF